MSNTALFALAAIISGSFVGCNAEAAEPQSLIAEGSDGVAAIIHSDKGQCVGESRRAEWVAPGQPNVAGCWKMVDRGVVQIVFFDGDYLQLPRERFQPAKVM